MNRTELNIILEDLLSEQPDKERDAKVTALTDETSDAVIALCRERIAANDLTIAQISNLPSHLFFEQLKVMTKADAKAMMAYCHGFLDKDERAMVGAMSADEMATAGHEVMHEFGACDCGEVTGYEYQDD